MASWPFLISIMKRENAPFKVRVGVRDRGFESDVRRYRGRMGTVRVERGPPIGHVFFCHVSCDVVLRWGVCCVGVCVVLCCLVCCVVLSCLCRDVNPGIVHFAPFRIVAAAHTFGCTSSLRRMRVGTG